MESRHSGFIMKFIAAGGFLLLLFFLLPCLLPCLIPPKPSPDTPNPSMHPVPEFFANSLQHGDLLFREGRTLASEIARKASTKDQRFSHVGIIIKEENHFFVIHAIHDEGKSFHGVVQEDLGAFLEDGKKFGAFRMKLEESDLMEITQKARFLAERKTPYDHDYDLSESERLYCTEFIFYLFTGSTLESAVGTTEFLGKEVVAIDNLYENKAFFEAIF